MTVPQMAELQAPSSWRMVDFISDLHLSDQAPATFAAWQHYLENTPADAVFMLGDLFEVWVGDDAASAPQPPGAAPKSSFELRCAHLLQQASQRLALFFMPGNRDFLVGQRFMDLCGCRLLTDPTVLVFPGAREQRWLLSHGDALCLDDVNYMQFRQQVRSPGWQQAFLAKPLAERQAMARGIRQQSQQQQQDRKRAGAGYVDLDSDAARQWLQAAQARTLIHGHTHQPAEHPLGDGLSRVVLSDWDAQAKPPRADALRLTASGLQRIALLPS
ncbi:UDP-2,3-diacylglucosamine hydrolase [Polaromonas sp. OV174]|uniref:UDP-2,3-diacylglucosamine diphosphatase n=1 Tax=Polaromonas sp. OV174 TaxID=1855300 RepID=UPI0008DFBCD5|nr:UDP-2,3-diacylglucosamine diphosphatase [Polaromonas sp. OV174]SFC10676.1 UDP-2,3-diacylglucosamine hydrolase [Polaromonas sp. OV174]